MSATSNLKSFNYLEDGSVHFSVFNTSKNTTKLLAGVYEVSYFSYPKERVELRVITPTQLPEFSFPEKESLETILFNYYKPETVKYLKSKSLPQKLGILLYGKEGTGKSSILKTIYQKLITEQQAITFYIGTPGYIKECWDFIMKIRSIQDNPIIIFMDEFDSYFNERVEGVIKSFLDGYLSIDNCIFLAATNYIDKIPEAVRNRPSRFKYCIDIGGLQTVEQILPLVNNLLGDLFTVKDKELFTESLVGSTLDEIKQFCLDKVMNIKTTEKVKKKIGF